MSAREYSPSMVNCACGCGERFYGWHGEFFSAECFERGAKTQEPS